MDVEFPNHGGKFWGRFLEPLECAQALAAALTGKEDTAVCCCES